MTAASSCALLHRAAPASLEVAGLQPPPRPAPPVQQVEATGRRRERVGLAQPHGLVALAAGSPDPALVEREGRSRCARPGARPSAPCRETLRRPSPAGQACSARRPSVTASPGTRPAPSTNACTCRSPARLTSTPRSVAWATRPSKQVHPRRADEAGHEQVAGLLGTAPAEKPACWMRPRASPRSCRPASSPRPGMGDGDGGLEICGAAWPVPGASAPAARHQVGQQLVEQNSCGSRTMARPMATRWRWPPKTRAAGARTGGRS